jgi:hypothetical protein
MTRTMFAVSGPDNRGKTKSIGMAYTNLRQEGREIFSGFYSRQGDRRAAILIIDGVKVGFARAGDSPKDLMPDLKDLIAKGCAVIVCATLTYRSQTWRLVEQMASDVEPPYTVVRIIKDAKDAEADQDSRNRQTAEQIVAAVRQAIARAQPGEAA